MELSEEQQLAYEKYLNGENLFLSGPGGSGKSELIRHIYNDAINNEKNIHVTALTGCAALLLNCRASTLHSWAGIGLAKASVDSYVRKIRQRAHYKNSWENTTILVIDEVSMMSSALFDTLNEIGKEIRKSRKPFGGIQLIFSGDFYQLPPIGDVGQTNFCFESDEWKSTFTIANHIFLKKIFRQKDQVYANILNQIRVGKLKKNTIHILQECVNRKADNHVLIRPTKILPKKILADNENITEMNKLEGVEKEFQMNYIYHKEHILFDDLPTNVQRDVTFMSNNLACNQVFRLKVGAQVMSVINKRDDNEHDLVICNGSRGVVTSFCPDTGFPFVQFDNRPAIIIEPHVWVNERIEHISVSQLPLILAWAITIHKSQGCTLDVAEINVGNNIFECGQTYVALSRVKSLQGLYLTSFDFTKITVNKKVKDFYNEVMDIQEQVGVKRVKT
jgi:ATP-dependent DNA helicase PIF1